MIIVTCKNLKSGEVFEKRFTSPYLAHVFINKCRFSRKIRVIGTCATSFAAYEEMKRHA